MRTMIIEGGRAAPQGREKAVAVVIVFVLPGPVDQNGQKRTPDFFVAVGADPANHTQVWMGIPGGIMTVTSHCPRTAVEALMINLRAMGWEPRPGQGGKVRVQDAVSRPYAPKDVPGQLFLQYLLDLQVGMMRPEDLPPWLAVTGKSQQAYRPCGAVVGPRGPAVGSPCPDGPCQLNGGRACVWRTHSGSGLPAPQPVPQDSGWREQATMASQLSGPTNGGPTRGGFSAGQTQPATGYTPPAGQQWRSPPVDPGVVHPPGGDFVLDMSPSVPPVGEFTPAPAPTPAPEPQQAAPPRKVTRKRGPAKKTPAKKRTTQKKSPKS